MVAVDGKTTCQRHGEGAPIHMLNVFAHRAGVVLRQWSVENNLHFFKDCWWDKDRHYLRRPGLAERMAVLTSCALAVLQIVVDTTGNGIRRQGDLFAWLPKLRSKFSGLK